MTSPVLRRIRREWRRLTAPRPERDTEILRAELFSIEQLRRHAVALARQHTLRRRAGPDRLLKRLAANERALLSAYAVVTRAAEPEQRIAPAEAWLLDNFYLIEQQIELVRLHLPRGYSRELPQLATGALAGYPRIYALALALISHQDGRVDDDNAANFIAAYQSVTPLRLGELWAFPIMLRLALLENVRRVASQIARNRIDRETASAWADRMLETAEKAPKELIHLLAEFARSNAGVALTAPFVEEFYGRLQAQGPMMAFAQAWIEHHLMEDGTTATHLLQVAGRTEAANQLSIANSIGSLRFVASTDWREFVEAHSVVEHTLREDPSGTHARQDFATRDLYRHVVEDIARGTARCTEADVAAAAVQLARTAARRAAPERRTHVGYYLIGAGRERLERVVGCRVPLAKRTGRLAERFALPLYVGSNVALTALATWALLAWNGPFSATDWRDWLLAVATALAASALVVPLVNRVVVLIAPPRRLPRLDFQDGIPAQHRTMVVVPTLLRSEEEIAGLVEALEIRYLGNRDPNLTFALLTDFEDAPEATQPGDEALLAAARRGINALNEKYRDDRPCIFYLFHRSRTWNEVERTWMGYERKRGKLEQFNALLRGQASGVGHEGPSFTEIVGDTSILPSIACVITLDTDTQLPRDAARKLVGNMAHPLNRPVYDVAAGRVVDGYAILQPLTSVSLASATRSRFARLFALDAGIDPYTRDVSDVYQDLFGEGSFVGKGIYDVDAFRRAVDGRFPRNVILSHDLLEGGYARSALVTDVDLIEDHPSSYNVETSRRHRWMRGDWQIAGWLLPRVQGGHGMRTRNPLSALTAWKIADNLRRSLVPPALLVVLAGGWLLGAAPAWAWTAFAAVVVLAPAFFDALVELPRKPRGHEWPLHVRATMLDLARPVGRGLVTLAFLPYDAFICIGAILQSGVRMLFTRRGLLCWHAPSYARRNARRTLAEQHREMWLAPALAAAVGGALFATRPDAAYAAAPLLLLWLAAPALAWWISQPLRPPEPGLNPAQRRFLRACARRTWRYFADFATPEDNWLPPDNFQEVPAPVVASRTSPTNIGMALLANVAAHDLGYVSTGELLRRTENTLASMEKLERYRGHFYNWYDTRTLEPLHPRYVSSVDSGNLVGSLLTLAVALGELKHAPLLPPRAFEGLEDTLLLLAEALPAKPAPETLQAVEAVRAQLQERPQDLVALDAALGRIVEAVDALCATLAPEPGTELAYWAGALEAQAVALLSDLRALAPEPQRVGGWPTLAQLAAVSSMRPQEALEADAAPANGPLRHPGAEARLRAIDDLIERCHGLAAMDFEFLYDASCGLLSIGYDVGERRRDPSHYDLLASEARLASFLLIAQGQVPQKHWFALGRSLTRHGGAMTLLSWSGSMFEYLMPQLLMPVYENTLLEETCRAAVARQIEYGRHRGVPWGISESCYNVTDANQVYQYRAFGVPGLGFKRGLADDLVIAPYASALALLVSPADACRNLQALAADGFLGPYGFYESIDYTPARLPPGSDYALVRTFMAHHQGMSLLSFLHVLSDGPMQRRFMADPEVRATELLLQERVPKQGPALHPHAAEVSAAAGRPAPEEAGAVRIFTDPNTVLPEVQLLSNGRYHVMATQAGGGYSRWHDLALTRWREDATCDHPGTSIYLRDRASGRCWSTTYLPTLRRPEHYEAIFVQARAEYRRRDHAIETHVELCVSPEDDVEIRRVTLTNLSSQAREIELTTYAEIVLAPLNADLAHRVFSNLFVQTEIVPERQAILCTRRRRSPEEHAPCLFHLLAAPGVVAGEATYETDRARFLGRGRTLANPLALEPEAAPALSNTEGSVLDPVVAVRRTVTLLPDRSACVYVITGVAGTRGETMLLLEKYGDRHFLERAFEMAWFHSQETLRRLNMTESDAQLYCRLAASVIHANAVRRAPPGFISRNRRGQSGLWRFAISGDLPIVLVRIGDLNRLELVRQAIQAHAYWRSKGLSADLVILNEDFSGYRAELHDRIIGLINAGPDAHMLDRPGGVFVRRAEELTEEDRVLFFSVARIVLTDSSETLAEQARRRILAERLPEPFEPTRQRADEAPQPLLPRERIFYNGLGGFTPDGREYVITLEPDARTPAPWVNVIASPHIGTVVSEAGSAYTWVENAHEFRLTTWYNDPVADSTGEALYVRDEETGAFWSPTPLPAGGTSGYVCRHGFGYTVYEHFESGIASELYVYVAMDAPVKFAVLKLRNDSGRTRRLSATAWWELVLGEWRHGTAMHVVTETDPHSGALLARNAFAREFSNRIVFAQVSESTRSVTGSRGEFIGRNGSLARPAAMLRSRLSGKTGAGLDPCAALQAPIELAEGQTREVVFILGTARSDDEAQRYIQRYAGPAGAHEALETVWRTWNHLLGAVQVETPDRGLDVLANGWLVYQTLSCRVWGRSGYYQSGGAYGFRDQLQDTMALVHAAPLVAREQLLRCAERQFLRGDVQHWWHPPSGHGVRTHFSDDYLWLPYAACRYVAATGDTGVLDEPASFLEGRELNPEEESYYDQPQRSTQLAPLYEHCVRALKHGLRFGEHGLPLIGCGDWNDGMNLVGRHGRGESVWLAWFLYDNLVQFARLAGARGDAEFAKLCDENAERLRASIEANAWDGAWYRRAYFDDGTPLGSATNDECRIDSISQSWAVLSRAGDPERARQAMAAVDAYLVNRDARLVLLLAPPFDQSPLEPGYIKGYVPGVRENGGQYTHAAVWAAMAFALQGDRERAWELFSMLNPVSHGSDPDGAARYKVEPYVVAADVYSAPAHLGRGGWSWYTGAAGWMYRLVIETLLGLHREVEQLRIAPNVPDAWPSYTVRYRFRDATYHIVVRRTGASSKRVLCATLDGHPLECPDGRSCIVPLAAEPRDRHVDIEVG